MKFVWAISCALLAASVVVRSETVAKDPRDNALDEKLKEFLESFKQAMACGMPDLGIPVLAPFEHDHLEVNIEQKGIKFKGELNNLVVDGLNEFEVRSIHVNLLKLQLTFEFHFGSIRTKGKYKAKGKVLGFIPFQRKGPFRFDANGLTLNGSVKLHVSGDKVQLRELQIVPTLASVKSDLKNVFFLSLNTFIFNRVVESVVPGLINDNQQDIAALLEENLKPVINELLGELTLQDLIDMASGDGSGMPVTC